MRLAATLIFCIVLTSVSGQSIAPLKTIEIDTITNLPKESVPFDELFLFKIHTPIDTKVRSFSIEEVRKNGELKPDTWREHKAKFHYSRPKRRNYYSRREFKNAKRIFRLDKSQLKKRFKENKEKYPQTTYPVFHDFDSRNEKVVSKKRKEVYLPIRPVDPSTNYKVTLLTDNDGFVNSLLDVVSLVDTDVKKAERNFHSIFEQNVVPGETVFVTTFNEFWNIVTSFPLIGLQDLTDINSPDLFVFIVRQDDEGAFTIDEAKRNASDGKGIVFNSEFQLRPSSSSSAKYIAPKEFRITFDDQLRDSKGRILSDNSQYKIVALYRDDLNQSKLVKSDLLTYDQKKFTPPAVPTEPIKIGKSSVEITNEIDDIKKDLTRRLSTYKPQIPVSFLNEALKSLAEIQCGDSQKVLGEIFCKNKDEVLKVYKHLPLLTTDKLRLMVSGLITFDNLEKEEGENNFSTRLKNLENTLGLLDKTSVHLKYLRATAPAAQVPDVTALNDTLQSLVTAIKTRATPYLNDALKRKQSISQQLIGTQRFVRPSSFTSTTEVFAFKSRANFRVVPDFGLIGVMKGGNSARFTDLVPYLGFHVNLRPINKDIPFSALRGRRTIWNYVSVMSGVTLTSIKINNQREDLFSIGTLMTGLGIRANNVLKLTTGMVWFKAYNTNSLMEEKKLKFSPFVGISLDMDLQDRFGGLGRLFK